MTWFFLILYFLDEIFSEYPHPNIFLMLFLKSQKKTDVIPKKLVVTHVPGRFSKKWTDGRTQRVLSHHTKYNLSHKWYFTNKARSIGIFLLWNITERGNNSLRNFTENYHGLKNKFFIKRNLKSIFLTFLIFLFKSKTLNLSWKSILNTIFIDFK